MTTEATVLPPVPQPQPTTNEEVSIIGQNVPMKKRKKAEDCIAEDVSASPSDPKRIKLEDNDEDSDELDEGMKRLKRAPMSKAREIRLEQNRKAARESRRRKKVMIEELQRSVIFFSRANGTLKQQNDELSRLLMQAQAQVASIESGQSQEAQTVKPEQVPPQQSADGGSAENSQNQNQFQNMAQQAQAQAVATQAMYESQGFPPAAARAAAQTMNASAPGPAAPNNGSAQTPAQTPTPSLPPMQPGATMQAMANFQQAAAAAMQAAMGMNPASAAAAASAAATAASAPASQPYNEALNALAMQQAAAVGQAQFAVLGLPQMQQNMTTQFMAHPTMIWQQPNAAANSQTMQQQQQQQPPPHQPATQQASS